MTPPDCENVAPAHLNPNMRHGHPEAEVSRHRTFPPQQALQETISMQIRKTLDREIEQFNQGSLHVCAPEIKNPTARNISI
jgi:hypothetical protein